MSPRELPSPIAPKPAGVRDVYTVSGLTGEARRLLETSFPQVWVEGELSNLSRPSSGHLYFSLKDEGAQVRCALFRNRRSLTAYEPREGAQVLVRARVTLYEHRGDFQLVIQHIEDAGEGALRRAFEALKRRLADEGLFDPAHKLDLPRFPRSVGIITSATGAAVRDIVMTFRRRCPAIPLVLYPVAVQGDGAPADIMEAIRVAQARAECDLLILARGGGSLEDLRAFNDEGVARAIRGCAVPVISGVGHESDVTIADLVADQRAATPTAAAELAAPDAAEVARGFAMHARQLQKLIERRLEQNAQAVDWLVKRLIHPGQRLLTGQQRLSATARHLHAVARSRVQCSALNASAIHGRLLRRSPDRLLNVFDARTAALTARLFGAGRRDLERLQQRLHGLSGRLHAVSPLATLDRGYAVVTDTATGSIVSRAADINVGSDVDVRLARGRLRCAVKARSSGRDG